MSQTPEQRLTKEIMLFCSQQNWLCFHINVGKGYLIKPDGSKSYFQTGLPKGASDLWILTDDGKLIFCETKIHPRKPTPDQLNFISQMRARGFNAFVAYSLQEFIFNIQSWSR